MKVLAIGNSFSQDAMRFLSRIAEQEGEELFCVNLYIGGCSLERHVKNLHENLADYRYEENGEAVCRDGVTLREGLEAADWDVITMQQASHCSFDYATYQPYLGELDRFVRAAFPNAKRMLHQTWAYEQGSERLKETAGFDRAEDMYEALTTCYRRAAREIGADGIIPSGKAMFLAASDGLAVHRDTFHASMGFGRFLLGCTWFETLFGKPVTRACMEEVTEQEAQSARAYAHRAVSEFEQD